VRRNPVKIEREAFLAAMDAPLSPLSYAPDGYVCETAGIGRHPLHHAGALYSQDPGAMAPLSALTLERGWCVADLCASPGGKSTQIAAAIGEEGFLLSNEIHPSRCRVLASNVERLGVQNTLVTNTSTDVLASWFAGLFDLVVVDAPCSGEGMFRKYDYAGDEWKPELVPMCAERQAEILENAARLLRDGGYLLYSTCTFSLEENEQNVDRFLSLHPDFTVCEVAPAVRAVTADGIPFVGAAHPDALLRARRFYPHLSAGEGQFMCLLRREEGEHIPQILYRDAGKNQPSKEEYSLAERFMQDTLDRPWRELLPAHTLIKQGSLLYLAPAKIPLPPHSVYLPGIALGSVTKGRLEPHHHYFSALGRHFKHKLAFLPDDPQTLACLHGETVPASLPNGYAVVTVAGAPLGGVKVVNGVAKNHYPKGLRNP
jgi:16S rRNA C967 or C1407 C5-methylase (RsmB/RsmF family)/NOL1/NOP2/fmu family ribosome biogenesis protein